MNDSSCTTSMRPHQPSNATHLKSGLFASQHTGCNRPTVQSGSDCQVTSVRSKCRLKLFGKLIKLEHALL